MNIPILGVNCEGQVDADGGVRILYNAVNFSSNDLKELEKFRFMLTDIIEDDDQLLSYEYDDDTASVLMDFELTNDKHLKYIYNNTDLSVQYDEDNNIIINELPPGFEQVYIKDDGHLYARTNIDTLRQYLTGRFEVVLTYTSNSLYESTQAQGVIYLQRQDTNIDLLSYDLIYNEQNESITCYVNEYNIDNDEYQAIDTGSVQFFIDNIPIGQSAVMNGTAVLPPTVLKEIEYGKHLLQAVYIPENNSDNTYTYTSLQLRKIRSPNITAAFVTTLKGH